MKYALGLLLTLIPATTFAQDAVHVQGYERSDGTYVKAYERTAANGSKLDNWSSKGNANPYTGIAGQKSIYETHSLSHSGFGM